MGRHYGLEFLEKLVKRKSNLDIWDDISIFKFSVNRWFYEPPIMRTWSNNLILEMTQLQKRRRCQRQMWKVPQSRKRHRKRQKVHAPYMLGLSLSRSGSWSGYCGEPNHFHETIMRVKQYDHVSGNGESCKGGYIKKEIRHHGVKTARE